MRSDLHGHPALHRFANFSPANSLPILWETILLTPSQYNHQCFFDFGRNDGKSWPLVRQSTAFLK